MSRTPIQSLLFSIVIQASLIALAYLVPEIPIGLLLIIALIFSLTVRLSGVWILFNASLPVATSYALYGEFPGWLFALGALLLALLHLPAWWTQVPYYPTPPKMYEAILDELPKDISFKFVDIGCGFGGLLCYLSHHRPQGTFEGVEISLLPFFCAKLKCMSRSNIRVRFKSFWKMSFHSFNYIYAFLSPAPMKTLWNKISLEAPDGSIFLSNSFEAPAETLSTKKISDERGGRLYIYKVKRSSTPHKTHV